MSFMETMPENENVFPDSHNIKADQYGAPTKFNSYCL